MPLPPPPDLDEDIDLETTCALLGVSVDDVIAEFHRREAEKRVKMVNQMALAARAGGERRVMRDAELGDGRVGMMIHPVSYHYWGQRLGYECWDDAQFVREYQRDNPESRVKTRAGKTSVTVDAKLAPAAPKPAAAPILLDAYGRAAA